MRYILSLLFVGVMVSGLYGDKQENYPPITYWYQLANDIKCTITANNSNLSYGESPIITVKIKYLGESSCLVGWDDDFGRLLWGLEFAMISKSARHREDTSRMMWMTGGIYYPKKRVKLEKGMEIESTLTFSDSVGHDARNLFSHPKGPIKIRLFAVDQKKLKEYWDNIKRSNKHAFSKFPEEIFVPVSNELTINRSNKRQ